MTCVNSRRFALSVTLNSLTNNPVSNNHRKFNSGLTCTSGTVCERGFIFVRLVRVVNVMLQRNLYVKYYSVKRHLAILYFRNSRKNGYKLWVQWFLGSIGWNTDWSMVFKATINQSKVTLVHRNYPRHLCAESIYPFPLQFLEWEMSGKLREGDFFRWYDSYKSCIWLNYISLWTLRICVEGGLFERHDSYKSCKWWNYTNWCTSRACRWLDCSYKPYHLKRHSQTCHILYLKLNEPCKC